MTSIVLVTNKQTNQVKTLNLLGYSLEYLTNTIQPVVASLLGFSLRSASSIILTMNCHGYTLSYTRLFPQRSVQWWNAAALPEDIGIVSDSTYLKSGFHSNAIACVACVA